ncbi:hypothetical protein FRC11_006493, partial [Ceratobasidium sp. 423]
MSTRDNFRKFRSDVKSWVSTAESLASSSRGSGGASASTAAKGLKGWKYLRLLAKNPGAERW